MLSHIWVKFESDLGQILTKLLTSFNQSYQSWYVRIMSKASHKDTDKRRVNQVNENSKLKSKIYKMQKLYVQRKEER